MAPSHPRAWCRIAVALAFVVASGVPSTAQGEQAAPGQDAGRGTARAVALRQYEDTIYELPKGWRLGARDGYARLFPDDSEVYGYCTIALGLSEPLPNDAGRWLKTRMKGVLGEGEAATAVQPVQHSRQGALDVWVTGQGVDGDLQMHFAVAAAGRVRHVWFEGPADTDGRRALDEVFLPLVSGLRFVGAGARPLLGTPRAGDLQGTYFGAVMGYGLGGVEVQNRFYSFTREGRFYEGVPVGRSLATLDFAASLAREGDSCGNYRFLGKKLKLDFANGERRELTFARDGEALVLDGDHYWLQEPLADGTRLDGCWRSLHYTSFTPGSGVVGGAGSTHSLTLRKDGTFESEGFGFASANFETPAGDVTGGFSVGGEKGPRKGRYEVKDGVLRLTDTRGVVSTRNVFMLSPRVLLLDGESHIDKSKPESPPATK